MARRFRPWWPGVAHATPVAIVAHALSPNAATPPGSAFTPAQIRQAYGFNQVTFGSVQGDGTGQTIAIIDAFDDPNIAGDLKAFDTQFGLPAPPSFTKVAQDGSQNLPAASGTSNWSVEESLDVEWAHAAAPGANIMLVEASDSSYSNLLSKAENFARNQSAVSVISMSFGGSEFFGESSFDSGFVTPAGHKGITFLASTGDSAAGEYPAMAPNVVAVGGTSLTLDSNGNYLSESGWASGGGGISQIESQPAYQKGVVTQSATNRTVPDVAMVADPKTGVAVYDSYDFASSPWVQVGGTSLSCPLWAGVVAVADQGRATVSLPSLDGKKDTLPMLYNLPASDFHDITTGNNGNAAAVGYDLVTGLGTPLVNRVVYGFMGTSSISGTVFQDNNGDGIKDGTDTPIAGATVYLDSNSNGVLDTGTTTTVSSTTPGAIPDNDTAGLQSTLSVAGTSSPVSNVSVTLNIVHPRDSDLTAYLTNPSGMRIELFSNAGGTGHNFTNTTFSDQAAGGLSGSAPFTGTYQVKVGALANFNALSGNGAWQLTVLDSAAGDTGTLQSWSLNVTTGAADIFSTTTNASGGYAFNNLPRGVAYNIREILPAGDVQTTPAAGSGYAAAPLFTALTGMNFGNFSTVFNTSGDTGSYYVAVDPSDTFLQISNGTSASTTPAYQIALSTLGSASLTFNLSGASNVLVIDFANGSPIPGGNISVNANPGSSDELQIFGQDPSQQFTMTDTQIGPSAGGIIYYQNLPTLTLANSTTNFTGTLSTLQNLNINSGETFNFD